MPTEPIANASEVVDEIRRVRQARLYRPDPVPQDVLEQVPDAQRLRLPMRPHNRSLNLSNAVAVMVYEAWRQAGFSGGG